MTVATIPLYSIPSFRYSAERGGCLGSGTDTSETDETLMVRYQRGDLAAFDQLYTRYEPRLFGYLVRLTRDRGAAEEIFQETFLRVVRSAGRFEEKSFAGWIFTIARRQWIDRCRHEARRPASMVFEAGEDLLGKLVREETNPEELVQQAEFQEKIGQLLKTLPPEQAEVFLLRVQGEMEYHEIAELMEVPMETVKSRMRYAVTSLGRRLRGKER